MAGSSGTSVPEERILRIIIAVRGEKVILDADLAELYGVASRRLNEQVRRNVDKFPDDFMFKLSKDEYENLKSQFSTSSSGWGGRQKVPWLKMGVKDGGQVATINFRGE